MRRDLETFLNRPRADGSRRAPAGRNHELQALRAFAKFALRESRLPTDPTAGIPFAREAPRDPAVLSVSEVRRLFTATAKIGQADRRNRDLAILALLSQAGLRVHELVGLDVDQVDVGSATLVSISGKGGTVHDLPLNGQTIALLNVWVMDRARQARPEERALFVSRRGCRLSVRSVQRLLVGLRAALGTAKRITPHSLRHSCATIALTLGADLSTVAEVLRHSDLNTTRRYLHLVDERRREAVRRLAVGIPESVLPVPAGPPPTGSSEPAVSSMDATPRSEVRSRLGGQNVVPFPAPARKRPLDVHDDMDDAA